MSFAQVISFLNITVEQVDIIKEKRIMTSSLNHIAFYRKRCLWFSL